MNNKTVPITKKAIFKKKKIRKTIHRKRWWFAVKDVIIALTNKYNTKDYIKYLRRSNRGFARKWRIHARPLFIETAGGMQEVNCASAIGLGHLIQHIPSRKAKDFKRWLVKEADKRIIYR